MRLTAKQIEHCKADPHKRQEIPAGPPKGLYLVVQPSGVKSWAFRYRWLGRPAKLTLGRYPDLSLAGARADAEAALATLAEGRNPAAVQAAEKQPEPNSAEVVAEEWLARDVRPRVRTAPEVERVMTREILPLCKHKLISQIGRADILRLVDSIVDRGAPIAANETLSIAKRWLNWCVQRGYIEASPAAIITPPSKKQSRDRVLTDSELLEVWTAADAMSYPSGPFLKLLILTAQRRGEVARIRWADLDLDKALWTLPKEETKSERVHDVPLSKPAIELLRGLPRFVGPFVFTTKSGAQPINSFSKLKVALDAKVAGSVPVNLTRTVQTHGDTRDAVAYVLHDLRRTAATWLASAGTPPHVLSALLNHSPGTAQGVLSIYNRHRYADERRAALDAWAKHVTGLSKQKARRAS